MRTSDVLIVAGFLAAGPVAGCLGVGPTRVLFVIGTQPFMREAASFQLSNFSDEAELELTLRVCNTAAGTCRDRQVTVPKPAGLPITLDARTVPELESGKGLIPVEVSATMAPTPENAPAFLQSPVSTRQEARFHLVRDKGARLPPAQYPPTTISRPAAGARSPWIQVEDTSRLEDVALATALQWGGRGLALSAEAAPAAELAALPEMADYVPPVEFVWYRVSGTFPKHVVPAAYSTTGTDAIAAPTAIRALVPRIRDPFLVKTVVDL
ncbi:MAG: hypothetical protein FJZ01_07260 [Candidatus Sericytochromatia bacterium]|nr:hypothetical protein [Candidatus Tanganyikabacteria bacterium]